jgi:hypothetical protein
VGRTIIVGDVHGCRDELDALLDRVAFSTGDRLVFVGDLVARGPDSLGVLDIVRRTGAIVVRGNHEEKVLQWRNAGSVTPRLGRMHAEVAASLRPVDWTLLGASPYFLELPEHGCVVVHAGVAPGTPISEQPAHTLMHVRCITPRGQPSEDKASGALWGALYEGEPHVVFGHNARSEPQLHAWATGIDTACVYGGRLTALVLAPGERVPRGALAKELLVHQQAFRVHYDWVNHKRIPAHDDDERQRS